MGIDCLTIGQDSQSQRITFLHFASTEIPSMCLQPWLFHVGFENWTQVFMFIWYFIDWTIFPA